MRWSRGLVLAGLAVPTGCTSHLVYAERAHFGLHVNVKPDATDSPYEFDLGYRRAVVAFIPHEQPDAAEQAAAEAREATPAGEAKESKEPAAEGAPGDLAVVDGAREPKDSPRSKKELMSLYTSFSGNIGFNDPIEYRHVLATGRAAKCLARNAEALAALRARLEVADPEAEDDDAGTDGDEAAPAPAAPAKKDGGS